MPFKLNIFEFPNLFHPCHLNNFSFATSSSVYCLFVNDTNQSTHLISALSSTFPLSFAATLLSKIIFHYPLHPCWTLFFTSYSWTVNPKYLKSCTLWPRLFVAMSYLLYLSPIHTVLYGQHLFQIHYTSSRSLPPGFCSHHSEQIEDNLTSCDHFASLYDLYHRGFSRSWENNNKPKWIWWVIIGVLIEIEGKTTTMCFERGFSFLNNLPTEAAQMLLMHFTVRAHLRPYWC